MAKTESTFLNMVVVLTTITIIAGAALGLVYNITLEPIQAAAAAKQKAAIESVVPSFDELGTPFEVTINKGTPEEATLTIVPALKEGEQVGAAVESITKEGFAGEIKLMVGFDNSGVVQNYSVVQHGETPGLGSKMQEWFHMDKNRQSILGRNPATENFTVSKDGGDVDAITAATISSRAFLKAVNNAHKAYMSTLSSETK